MHPKVSIIIPCYNQEEFLADTLNSVLLQEYGNWECLIIDDGSTDNSVDIIHSWCKKDSRFRLLSKTNGGLSSARNYGLNHAHGDWIQFLDGDDMLYNKKLSTSLNEIANNTQVIITSFNHVKKGQLLPPFCKLTEQNFSFESILTQWDLDFSIPIHCAVFRKDLISDIRFEETITAGEDWIFWLKAFRSSPKTIFINEELVCYRLHERSITQNATYMLEHKHQAQLIIFDLIEDKHKKSFFDRFSREALTRRAEMFRRHELDTRKRERKLKKRIKRFMKNFISKSVSKR